MGRHRADDHRWPGLQGLARQGAGDLTRVPMGKQGCFIAAGCSVSVTSMRFQHRGRNVQSGGLYRCTLMARASSACTSIHSRSCAGGTAAHRHGTNRSQVAANISMPTLQRIYGQRDNINCKPAPEPRIKGRDHSRPRWSFVMYQQGGAVAAALR